jgi:hypothetical protein
MSRRNLKYKLQIETIIRKQIFQDLVGEVEAHTVEYLFGTHRVEGVPYDVIPDQMLESESYGHYRDHMPAIHAWINPHIKK